MHVPDGRTEAHTNDATALRAVGFASQPSAPTLSAQPSTTLWIDAVGGFLLWDRAEFVLGQACAESSADTGIVGDLSRRAGVIRRVGTDYLLQPLQDMKVDGTVIDRPLLLRDSALIEIGNSVKIRFRRANSLSGTATLELASIHRWKPNVDAVLLLSDCAILGPRPGSHILCRDWTSELMIFQKSGRWQLRCPQGTQANNSLAGDSVLISPKVRVSGEDFSLSFE